MFKTIFVLLAVFAPLGIVYSSPIIETSSIQPIEPQNPSETAPFIDQAPHLESNTKEYESAFIKMIIFLIGLLIFVFIVFFLFKKLSSSRMQHNNHFRTIKILEKRAISPKSMLYLVEVGGKKILLAESQLEIRNISNLEWVEPEKKGI